MQARYNLRNLINPNRSIDVEEMLILSRLCETVGVSVDVATRIANSLHRPRLPSRATPLRRPSPLHRPRSLRRRPILRSIRPRRAS